MTRARPWTYVLLFVLGGVGIAVLDHLHVAAGATSYPDPTAFGQPWWVVPQFGLATILAVVCGRPFVRGQRSRPRELPWRIASFAVAYATTAILWEHSLPLLAILVAAWVGVLVLSHEPPSTVVYCVLFAAIGTAYEMALVASGVFSYSHPEVLGVQWWLPSLYLVAGLLGVALARTLPGPPAR